MYSHVETCKSSRQPQKIYCKQKSLALSTFLYWAKKYREEFSVAEASDETLGFISLQVQPDPEPDQVHAPGQLHFLFPNGIQVMCPESVNPEVLRMLLNS